MSDSEDCKYAGETLEKDSVIVRKPSSVAALACDVAWASRENDIPRKVRVSSIAHPKPARGGVFLSLYTPKERANPGYLIDALAFIAGGESVSLCLSALSRLAKHKNKNQLSRLRE